MSSSASEHDPKYSLSPFTQSVSDLENSELIILTRHILTQCLKLRLEDLLTIGALEFSLSALGDGEKRRIRKPQEDKTRDL